MSSNPHPYVMDLNAIARLLVSKWCRHEQEEGEEGEDKNTSSAALPDTETNVRDSADARHDTCSSEEYFSVSEDEENDSAEQQELRQIESSLKEDREVAASSNDGPVFSGERVEQIGECFKHVVNECSANSSSKALNSRAGEVLNRSVDMATKMAKGDEVQLAVLELARSDSSFMRHVDELGEEIDALRVPVKLSRRERRKLRKARRGDLCDPAKDPWYIRFVEALWKLCRQLGELGSQAINLIVNKIMACFNVAKTIAQNIYKGIQRSLLWIRRAIIDPQGEIRKILDDPERSNPAKALGVIGVVATAIVGALLLACGIGELGTCGLGAALAGAATSAAVRMIPHLDPDKPATEYQQIMRRRT